MPVIIRDALLKDLNAIVSIYNAVIKEGGFTADIKPYSLTTKKEWFSVLKGKKNILVIEKDQALAGYFYFSPWREGREALKSVAEISFYLAKDFRQQGLGNMIMSKAITIAKKKGFSHLLAILLDSNKASVALLKKHGFEKAGHLPGIARFKDYTCGQYLMQKKLI